METEICLQLKCSVSLPVVIDCQKDSGTTVENGTQVKPVLLTAIIFAVCLALVFPSERGVTIDGTHLAKSRG